VNRVDYEKYAKEGLQKVKDELKELKSEMGKLLDKIKSWKSVLPTGVFDSFMKRFGSISLPTLDTGMFDLTPPPNKPAQNQAMAKSSSNSRSNSKDDEDDDDDDDDK
jgi:hypothetical protein